MKPGQKKLCILAAALLLALPPAMAQTPPAADSSAAANAAPAGKTLSQQELDQLLAPIALYPDALLAQIFMASTYPLEIVEAARWAKNNPNVTGKALEDAMANQNWDPSVKALAAVPQVLQQMSDRLDWSQKMGDAFLAQQGDVMKTVQSLRAKADASGNLKSSDQMTVKKETQGSNTVYVVESPKPDVVYVPTYNPTVVYGTWAYPAAPPYYMYPPSYVYPPGLAFATGVAVGAAIWGNCNWGHNDVDINVNQYNNFNRTSISNAQWNHNAEHRRGVAYSNQNVARQYGRGGDIQAARARENFRGRAEAGRNELSHMDRGELNNRLQNAGRNRGQLADRGNRQFGNRTDQRPDGNRFSGGQDHRGGDAGGRLGGGGSGTRNNGLSGLGNGASTREASARGAGSRDFAGRSGGFERGGGSSFSGRGGGGGFGGRGGGGGHGGRRR